MRTTALPGVAPTALSPWVVPPCPWPVLIEMPLSVASERKVQPGGEPERQGLDALRVRPVEDILPQQYVRLDGGRRDSIR
jgi:hypothetical protein